MNELHVGRGTTRGGMTVFPVWTERTGYARCTTDAAQLEVTECDGGPSVPTLMVGNIGDRPVLVLEGQLFEGGWQHRMATRSIVIGVHQRVPVEVACVEQGRWGGDVRQTSRGRRATPYVRDAVRATNAFGDVQGEVWRRVEEHTRGTDNGTGSLVRRLHAVEEAWITISGDLFPVLPGQSGVIIGIGGQPLSLEMFDSHRALKAQFDAIISAAGLDAGLMGHRDVETPARRALRFVRAFERAEMIDDGPAGVATARRGRYDAVDVAAVCWRGRDLHLRATNLAHPLLVAGGAL